MLPAPGVSATWAGRPSNVIGPSDALPRSKYVMAASSVPAPNLPRTVTTGRAPGRPCARVHDACRSRPPLLPVSTWNAAGVPSTMPSTTILFPRMRSGIERGAPPFVKLP